MDEFENIECFRKNKVKYRKCLKNFLNGLRQKYGQNSYKTIAKFKKLFGTDKEVTYKIADELYETSKTTYPATDFKVFSNFGKLLETFGGKTIKVIYIPEKIIIYDDDTDDQKAYKEAILAYQETHQVKEIYEVEYDVPLTPQDFKKWWDSSREWDWKTSDSNEFEINLHTGKVYITESVSLTPNQIQQSYLENETENCVFKPIIEICNKQIINPELSASSQRRYKAMLNKIKKQMPNFKTGVRDTDLNELCKKLQVKLTLKIPFSNRKMVYGMTNNKALITLSYINTRLNHVEVAGKFYNNDKPKYLTNDEFNDLYRSLIDNNKFYIYQKRHDKVYSLNTIDNNYRIATDEFEVFDKFEKKTDMFGLTLDDVCDELLSKFIRTGCHQTMSRINDKYRGRLAELQSIYKEVDCIKAFTQAKKCALYEGFLGKITDFRQTDKIEGIGFYLIGNLDWTYANKKLKDIQRTFRVYHGRNIYPSPELKFLRGNGVIFKIKGGCWGITHDFEFGEEMFEKVNNVRNFSKWTGMQYMQIEKSYYYMDTDDTTYAQHIMDECEEAQYNNGSVRFSINRDYQPHKSHMSGFIYAYQRINLMEQLYTMDISKIIRINTDGIKYLDHEFIRSPIFRVETKLNKDSFVNDDRLDGFITNTSDCDRCDWLEFHFHFLKTKSRTHYNTEIYTGQGGGGKTHRNLVDNGLIRPLYVAPSYKLTRAKQLEYNVETHVVANLISPNKYDEIIKKYNTIIIDEASMISDGVRALIFEKFKKCKIIFCGDVGFQAEPVEGTEIDVSQFENIHEVTDNHRSKCDYLDDWIKKIRQGIKNGERSGFKYLKGLQLITQHDLLDMYETKDIILTHQNLTIDMYNELIDKEKYIITKSDKKFSRGEVFLEKPNTKNIEKTNAFTTHSVQGETYTDNIFIDIELASNIKLLYTAVSRAKYLNQIHVIKQLLPIVSIIQPENDVTDYLTLLKTLPRK